MKIKVGNKVRLSGTDRIGTVVKIKGNKAKVTICGESSMWKKTEDLKVID